MTRRDSQQKSQREDWRTDNEGREGYVSDNWGCSCGGRVVVIWGYEANDGSDPVPLSCVDCQWTHGVEEA